jgi:hypothetical protein
MRPDTTRAAALLALALALPGCGDALEGSWKAELTCCDIKGTGFEGYFCGPNSPFKAQGGWSDTYNITFWGGRFELERRRGTQTPVGEHGFYIYDEAGGTLELRTCDGHDCGDTIDDPRLEREVWLVSLSEDGQQLVARRGSSDGSVMPYVLEGRPLTLHRQ